MPAGSEIASKQSGTGKTPSTPSRTPLPRPPRSQRETLRLDLLRLAGPLSRLAGRAPAPVDPPERILVVSPDHLGDCLFATPALRALRTAYDKAQITWMVGPWGQALAARYSAGFHQSHTTGASPLVDDILSCPFPGFERRALGSRRSAGEPYRLLLEWSRQLRAQDPLYDVAILLRPDHWWGAWLCSLAGVGRRVGYGLPEMRPFLTEAVPYQPARHAVEHNMALVEAMAGRALGQPGPLEFPLTQKEQEKTRSRLHLSDSQDAPPVITIHPGAGTGVKRWPPEAWARVADLLVDRYKTRILLTGSADETDWTWAVAARMRHPAEVLAGQTNLGELAVVLQQSALVAGADSGPLHLAVAMRTPTVHLYGPADPGLFGPWGSRDLHRVLLSDWPCIPCNHLTFPASEWPMHPCVRDISQAQVLNAIELLLG